MPIFRRKKRIFEIAPDEIFLDSSNLPDFNQDQFEGRIEHPIPKRTLIFLGVFFAVVTAAFTVRVVNLQIVHGETFRARAESNRLDHTPILAERGVIFDRNKVDLAWNEPFNDGDHEFPQRSYTQLDGFAHLLGYVSYPQRDSSGVFYQEGFMGKSGIEKSFNDILTGQNGLRIIETNAFQKVESQSVIQPPADGKNIVLSIDSRIQTKLAADIADLAGRVGFTGGAAAIMDVRTGELLALTSYPEYSPAVVSLGEDHATIQKELTDNVHKPFLDRAISGLYTPGSIVKPVLALAALEEHIISPNKQIFSSGALSIPNVYFPDKPTIFRDWKAHGWEDMRKAIAESSDEYFYQIGGGYKDQPGLGIERIKKYTSMFGYAQKTGIDLEGEAGGTIPDPAWKAANFDGAKWLLGDTYHSSIGQYGFQVTPIQALRAVAAVANGGTLLKPQFVLGFENPGQTASTTYSIRPVVQGQINMPVGNFTIVHEGMRHGVTEGVAVGLNTDAVEIAAKTGTAELGATKAFVNSWVTGYWPYDKPRYAFVVMMEHGPRGNTTGALYVMRQLVDWMAQNTPQYLKAATSTQ